MRRSLCRLGEPGDGVLRRPGSILLISCYELGHQPLSIASAAAFLERAGYTPDTLDLSVESFDVESMVRARFVGISVPMHTALRLGVRVAEQIRQTNPTCHICPPRASSAFSNRGVAKTFSEASPQTDE
jgi:hypothetical protein